MWKSLPKDSVVATSTVDSAPVQGPPVAVADSVITNLGSHRVFVVADWVLLANDRDIDSATLTITGISAVASLNVTHPRSTLSSAVTDLGTEGGTFVYAVSHGAGQGATAFGQVSVVQMKAATIDGTGGNDDVVLAADRASHRVNGAGGVDTVDFSAHSSGLLADMSTGIVTKAIGVDTLICIRNVIGGSGRDVFVAPDDGLTHRYDGGAGSDTIDFSHVTAPVVMDLRATGDTIQGGTGSIRVQGFEHVIGGSDSDVVIAGASANSFTGNGGADTLVFTTLGSSKTGARRDVFTDFTSGVDAVDLHLVDADARAAGTQHFTFADATAFWSGSGAEFARGSAGQARYHVELVGDVPHTILDLHTINAAGAANHQVDLGAGAKVVHAADLILH